VKATPDSRLFILLITATPRFTSTLPDFIRVFVYASFSLGTLCWRLLQLLKKKPTKQILPL
jgi:hypothetical protein